MTDAELDPKSEPLYRHWNGMCWPALGRRLSEIEWSLRYGSAESVRLVAASVVNAYAELIQLPHKSANKIVTELRKGPTDAALLAGKKP